MTTFGASSTTDEVLAGIDLTGKRVFITGVSAGLGVETARALAAHGASVVGAARDLAKAERATAEVRNATAAGGGSFRIVQLDLASLDSVRKCANQLLADGGRFDIVIANAGVMTTPYGRTADGFETQFGTNHLGHFLLINLIASLVPDNGRVVCLSSSAHRLSDVDLEDPHFDRTEYDRWTAYGRSKTANALFAVEFDRRHRGRGVRACSLMPGMIQTELGRHMRKEDMDALRARVKAAAGAGEGPSPAEAPMPYKTVPQGAAPSVWAGAVAPADLVGGRYCENCQVAEVVDDPRRRNGVRPYALDAESAKRLWAKSEELVGQRF